MKICPNCRHETEDQALCCPVCGNALDVLGHVEPTAPLPQYTPPIPSYEPVPKEHVDYDHTGEFTCRDISENKLLCMSIYILGVVGIIIALLMSPSSDYTRFHIRQGLRFSILEALLILASSLLCWTVLVPILGALALLILVVAKFVCFTDVCRGRAAESPILHRIRFLN